MEKHTQGINRKLTVNKFVNCHKAGLETFDLPCIIHKLQ